MKKTLVVILLLIAVVLSVGGYLYNPQNEEINQASQTKEAQKETEAEKAEEEISEDEFNESGQAKAIEDESDLWQIYDNPEIGISLKYPSDIILLGETEYNENLEQTYLKVETKDMGEKETPLDLSEEDEMKNVEALTGGKFGLNHDFPFEPSKKVRSVGFLFAQDFMVLARFEICSVTLERKLLFYFNNKRIIVTLYAPVDILKETMPEYFTVNNKNCGEMKIWNFQRQDEFYQELVSGEGSAEIQKWFDNFDQISETVIFAHK